MKVSKNPRHELEDRNREIDPLQAAYESLSAVEPPSSNPAISSAQEELRKQFGIQVQALLPSKERANNSIQAGTIADQFKNIVPGDPRKVRDLIRHSALMLLKIADDLLRYPTLDITRDLEEAADDLLDRGGELIADWAVAKTVIETIAKKIDLPIPFDNH